MPWFERDSIGALVGDRATGEYTLDLRGISLGHARLAITRMLERWRSADLTSVVIRIDPATATSGETLFLPIGRRATRSARDHASADRIRAELASLGITVEDRPDGSAWRRSG